jgi:hypothetical protein
MTDMDQKDNLHEQPAPQPAPEEAPAPQEEQGGSKRPEPTRYGDWEVNGRCIDF